tara:strand:- start:62 stop:430 length:369 start_codon:yes stop_codon:yes gene_type:complete
MMMKVNDIIYQRMVKIFTICITISMIGLTYAFTLLVIRPEYIMNEIKLDYVLSDINIITGTVQLDVVIRIMSVMWIIFLMFNPILNLLMNAYMFWKNKENIFALSSLMVVITLTGILFLIFN